MLNRKLVYCLRRKPNIVSLRQLASVSTSNNSTKRNVGILLFSSVCILAGGLGVWQMQRYNWKIQLIEETKEKLQGNPVVLDNFKSQNELYEYMTKAVGHRIIVEGVYDHEKEILLGPRSAPTDLLTNGSAQGLALNPQGYFIITPLKRTDGTTVFINRGWVSMKSQSWRRPISQTKIQAVVSSCEPSNTFSPINNTKINKLIWLEEDALLKITELIHAKPVVVLEEINNENDGDAAVNPPFPRSSVYSSNHHVTPLTHLAYAATWFSLSFLGSILTYKLFKKKI